MTHHLWNARTITQHRTEELHFEGGMPLQEGVWRKDLCHTTGGMPLPEGGWRKDLCHTTRNKKNKKQAWAIPITS